MCPGINLLKTYKAYPRVHQFNYTKDLYFLYVYLDPFQELDKPLVIKIDNQEYCFAYVPFYVGKGTGAGYRQNQHIRAFEKQTERNSYKIAAFQKLVDNMADAAAKRIVDKPWNMKEFQSEYVIILKTFNDPKQLLQFEMKLIQSLGTQSTNTGPLTNKIQNAYSFNHVATKRNFEL